jgi:hypothetical protein
MEASHAFRRADVDIIFLHVTTYTNVPMLLDVRQIRGNGRPARFLSDCTGETPMPPVQTKSLPAKGRWYYALSSTVLPAAH